MRVKRWVFDRLTGRLGDFLGRANLVRVGGYLSRAGRFDVPDGISDDGERLVQATLAREARGLTTVVDCGAHTGEWSLSLLAAFREHGKIASLRLYCFEPSAPTFGQLVANLGPCADDGLEIHPIRKALSRRNGSAALRIVHEAAGTNSLTPGGGAVATETVETTTLTAFARAHRIERIHLLKIDAEGHDFEVLAGACEAMEAGAIDVIQFEYNQRWIYGGRFLRDAFHLLAEAGYAVGKVTPRGIQWRRAYDWRLETFVQGNWLGCRPCWVPRFPKARDWLAEAKPNPPPDERRPSGDP